MKSEDIQRCIDKAMKRAKINKKRAPKLLSDNGSYYLVKDLAEYLSSDQGIKHIRGKPLHPQIKRKNRKVSSINHFKQLLLSRTTLRGY